MGDKIISQSLSEASAVKATQTKWKYFKVTSFFNTKLHMLLLSFHSNSTETLTWEETGFSQDSDTGGMITARYTHLHLTIVYSGCQHILLIQCVLDCSEFMRFSAQSLVKFKVQHPSLQVCM